MSGNFEFKLGSRKAEAAQELKLRCAERDDLWTIFLFAPAPAKVSFRSILSVAYLCGVAALQQVSQQSVEHLENTISNKYTGEAV